MAQRTGGVRRPLANASVYSLMQQVMGAQGVRRRFIADYLKPIAGERILDLGCGPGDILDQLPAVSYVGVDVSAGYVRAAEQRFGSRGRFICADVRSLVLDPALRFDAVISIGVLHHLDDEDASSMARIAASRLEPGGRMITLDPGLADGQPPLARWLIERDRGGSMRSPDGYRRLAEGHFGSVRVTVHHDLARVPYTHVVLECTDPRT